MWKIRPLRIVKRPSPDSIRNRRSLLPVDTRYIVRESTLIEYTKTDDFTELSERVGQLSTDAESATAERGEITVFF